MEEPENVYCEVIDSKKEVRQQQPPPLPKRMELISASFTDVQNLPGSTSPLRSMALTTNNCQRCRHNTTSKKQVVLSVAVAIFAILSAVFMTLYFTTEAKCRPCQSINYFPNNSHNVTDDVCQNCSITRNCSGYKLDKSNNTGTKKG